MTSRAAASRYARALFDVVLSESQDAGVEKAQADLQDVAATVASNEGLAQVFANPAIPAARKRALVEALLGHAPEMSVPVRKLILLLAERDRLALLADVGSTFNERVMDHQKVLRGEVTSAVALAPEKLRALEDGLGRATGRKVMLSARVDPAILGGVVTRIGSTVYDGSITTQLAKMKQTLIGSAQ